MASGDKLETLAQPTPSPEPTASAQRLSADIWRADMQSARAGEAHCKNAPALTAKPLAADGAAKENASPAQRLEKGEPRPEPLSQAAGSYYYKVASSFWDWAGLETTVRLGRPVLDPTRVGKDGSALDGFSIYLGGSPDGKAQVDAGLTWDYVRKPDGTADRKHKAWRPFYRNGHWHSPYKANCYWRPGETVSMSVSIVGPNRLRLHLSDPGPHPRRHMDIDFRTPYGFSPGRQVQFKRVDSIDQVHNERQQVKNTHSKVVGTQWLSASLLHQEGRSVRELPFIPARRSEAQAPAGHARVYSDKRMDAVGAQAVDIYGSASDLQNRH